MKTVSLKHPTFLSVLLLVFPLFNAYASGGVIHFQGSIVEDGCDLMNQEQSVKFSCQKNGKPSVQTVAFNKLNNFTSGSDAPFSTKMHYLDTQHKLAVVEVTYR
ncbi:hypothetical protein [Buttiauxella brennerae]|uniref:hypothetical protein n=1 Tax=Buttiauxella brennerae TaxID=82988 RepID=UPI00286F8458|nr:hypothetical protein [Buttiauxella brennerae]